MQGYARESEYRISRIYLEKRHLIRNSERKKSRNSEVVFRNTPVVPMRAVKLQRLKLNANDKNENEGNPRPKFVLTP